MDKEIRAWTYCRIDAPEDAHSNLKSQKKELFDYAEQMGFVVTGSSEDLGSGLDFKRTGLLEVMEWTKKQPQNLTRLFHIKSFNIICQSRKNSGTYWD